MEADLREARRQASADVQAFRQADSQDQEPSRPLLDGLEDDLEGDRAALTALVDELSDQEKSVATLAAESGHAGPARCLSEIDADLQEAQRSLQGETILQESRRLLATRIKEKITELAESVPRNLGERIGRHLARLTSGAYCRVHLKDDLTVTGVTEAGPVQEPWMPVQLSHGERYQVALAVKVAVARALTETTGPVFLVLDDSLVNFDPQRRVEAEKLLLDLVADGKLQVILLTCHDDWVADWKRRAGDAFPLIELVKVIVDPENWTTS